MNKRKEGIRIRCYRKSDLEACRALWHELTERHREIYDDPTIGGRNPGLRFDAHLKEIGPEGIWVVEKNDKVVGMMGLIFRAEEVEVEPLVVHREHRGQGIGTALLEFAVAQAKKMGSTYLCIRPVARNVEAIKLFYRSGFRNIGHVQLFMDLKKERKRDWKPGLELFDLEFTY